MFKLEWKATLILCSFFTLGFYWLISMARKGEPVGWVIIVAALVVTLLLMLVGGVMLIVRTIKTGEQTGFTHYAREQLVLMKQMQALQNAQTSMVARRNVQLEQMSLRQAHDAARRQLPSPENSEPSIIFGDDIFEQLDEEEKCD
jgi:hypothetical protein